MFNSIWNWFIKRFFSRPQGLTLPEISVKEHRIPESYWEDRWSK